MTLFIAWLLIDGFHMDQGLKVWAVVLWVMHLMSHSAPSAEDIAKKIRGEK